MADGRFDFVPASYARRGSVINRALGRMLMRLTGWQFEGVLPDVAKVVIAVAPHTSNWDFVVGVMALWALDIKISFLGKHTLFRGMFGTWLCSIGGIAVNREATHGVVGDVVRAFGQAERMVLALTPRGHTAAGQGIQKRFPAHRAWRGGADSAGVLRFLPEGGWLRPGDDHHRRRGTRLELYCEFLSPGARQIPQGVATALMKRHCFCAVRQRSA